MNAIFVCAIDGWVHLARRLEATVCALSLYTQGGLPGNMVSKRKQRTAAKVDLGDVWLENITG